MKNSKNRQVTKKGEYYFAKGFKVLVSCVKKNRYSLVLTAYYLLTVDGLRVSIPLELLCGGMNIEKS